MQLFKSAFASVPDPRAENVRHDLVEVLVIALLAVLCGAHNCTEMAEFGCIKIRFLKRFLKLTHGVPSHDTFSNVLRIIDPKALDAAFASLTATLLDAFGKGGVIAIDGKSLKGAHDKGRAFMPRMMISAYATNLRLTLATLEVEDGNEVEAALSLIGLIDLKGHIVTADALHCHREMAGAVTAKRGHYCLALKGNQQALLSQAEVCLAAAKSPEASTETIGHGRLERRTGIVVKARGIAKTCGFAGLKAFGRIEATRQIDGREERDVRIFALSRVLSAKALLSTVRAHWDIENGLHWQLDVTLREDAQRNRRDNAPANLAVLRRRALDIARRDTSKGSLAIKLKRAGWDHDSLLYMISHMR